MRVPPAGNAPDPSLVAAVRLFHAAGRSQDLPPEADGPLMPAVALGLMDAEHWRASLPLVVAGPGQEPVPMLRFLEAAADAAIKAGHSVGGVRQMLTLVTRAAGEWLTGNNTTATLPQVMDQVSRVFPGQVDTTSKGAVKLRDEWNTLRGTLPVDARVIGLGDETLPLLALLAEQDRHRPARQAFLQEVRSLARSLSDLLRAERARNGGDHAAPSLGALAADFVDPKAFAAAQPAARGPVGMDPAQRSRVEKALQRLEEHLAAQEKVPDVMVLRVQGSTLGASLPQSCVQDHARPLAAAQKLYDDLVTKANEVLRATRLARLALAGQYEPGRHDVLMEQLDLSTATSGERFALPAIVVLETGEQVRAEGLDALAGVLTGQRPIHVIVSEACNPEDIHPAGRPGSLADVALAYRETFVLAGTVANPQHLDAGLRTLASRLRPGVVVVAVPKTQAPLPAALWARLAWEARVTPCFRHDPDAGDTWAQRFDVEGNPAPEQAVLSRTHKVDGAPAGVELPASYAALALLSPAWRKHLRVLPELQWDAELVEFHQGMVNRDERRVPFTWAVQDNGTLQRVVMSNALCVACQERVQAWRLLRELGGVENSHAKRAVEAALAGARQESEQGRKADQQAHAVELEALRQNAASDTLDRLVAVLLNMESMPAAAPSAPRVEAPAAKAAPAAPVAPATPAASPPSPPPPPAAAVSEDPYTDSALCTTCNECTHINGRMFKYNANKQAYIADATAGTYAELVKAAEKCPSRCIHVGTPRAGDTTATPELLTRAKAFM